MSNYRMLRIPKQYDRRYKLTTEQKHDIELLYGTGLYSYRELAEEYGVHHSTIGRIIYHDNGNGNKRTRPMTKEELNYHKVHNRMTDAYKKQLYEQGKLK